MGRLFSATPVLGQRNSWLGFSLGMGLSYCSRLAFWFTLLTVLPIQTGTARVSSSLSTTHHVHHFHNKHGTVPIAINRMPFLTRGGHGKTFYSNILNLLFAASLMYNFALIAPSVNGQDNIRIGFERDFAILIGSFGILEVKRGLVVPIYWWHHWWLSCGVQWIIIMDPLLWICCSLCASLNAFILPSVSVAVALSPYCFSRCYSTRRALFVILQMHINGIMNHHCKSFYRFL